MSHHIEKCKHCGVVIQQCRCPDGAKNVRYSVCAGCAKKGESKMKVRKKPVVVDARGPITESELVPTAHGRVRAEAGDYIMTDPKTGDTWPIKPDIFQATYETIS